MNRQRLQFATAVFLNEMRRQAVKTGSDAKIGSLFDYSPEQRSALMNAVEKAIESNDPAKDQNFATWVQNQQKPETT